MATNEEIFKNAKVLPNLSHLGRAIVDGNGVPSGSPANFENLRGKMSRPVNIAEATKGTIERLRKQHPAPTEDENN